MGCGYKKIESSRIKIAMQRGILEKVRYLPKGALVGTATISTDIQRCSQEELLVLLLMLLLVKMLPFFLAVRPPLEHALFARATGFGGI